MELMRTLVPSLLDGTKTTIFVFIVTLLISYPLSLFLSVIQNLRNKAINFVFGVYITLERGTPLLLQMMFVYFGLPFFNITLNRMSAVLVAFILNYTAYFMEINRGGIESIDKGQYEACKVLGYTKAQTFIRIILPQAFKVTIPSVTNEVLALVKDTSLITVLGVSEVLKVGRNAVNTYATAIPFIYVAIIYLVLTSFCSFLLKRLEMRMDYYG
jgi:His/Glu/Gln/Arg/opine family amino acid ABC transporter permease subunit